MTCRACGEWAEIWANVGAPRPDYCPFCGAQGTLDMTEEDDMWADDLLDYEEEDY